MFNNLLKTALTAVPRQRVDFIAYAGRAADDLGRWLASYAQPVDAYGSFQPMGTKEAKENGFEVAGRYAKFLTDADIKPVRRDGAPDKIVYDGVTYDVIGVDNWFAQDGWKRVYLVEGDAVAVIPPDPTCTITLTGDIAAMFGAQPMTINGQTASAVQVDPPVSYLASTDYITMTPPPASGIAITEVDLARDGALIAQATIGDVLAGNYILVAFSSTGYDMTQYVGSVPSGSLYSSSTPANFALGYGSDGTLYAYVDGVQVSTSAMDAILPSGAYLAATSVGGSAGDTGSITFRTSAADFTQTYPAGTLDWCGNEL